MFDTSNPDECVCIIPLALVGDANSGIHVRDELLDPYQGTGWAERKSLVDLRCSCVDIVHGLFSSENSVSATLLVIEFQFEPRRQCQRVSSATIELKFSGLQEETTVEVHSIAPLGRFVLQHMSQETERAYEESAWDFPISGSATGVSTVQQQYSVPREATGSTTVMGSIDLRGRNFGGKNCVLWNIQENHISMDGIGTTIRTAVVVKRRSEAKFKCHLSIQAKAEGQMGSRSVYGCTPEERPLVFDPAIPLGNRLADYPNEELGAFDLMSLASIRVSSGNSAGQGGSR
ncbi:hypothetical protein GQ53DRAFT_647305 [Thozetella sp. PMI_491]|nr:hypothetical protein GQ53DRAFT_647305 [Thozetella sp. PMI_491]